MTDAELAMTGDMSNAAMSKRARAVRKAIPGLTQQALADRLGLTISAVKTWESEASNSGIRAKNIYRLSQIAGIRTDFIISGDISDVVIRYEFWKKVRDHLS